MQSTTRVLTRLSMLCEDTVGLGSGWGRRAYIRVGWANTA